jgi:hypothetical protein
MKTLADKPKWKGFEELVARIQGDLAGDATVTLNDKIVGKSGVVRQIDISIRKRVGQFDLLIVIDCKNHAGPIDINDVETFVGLVQDVAAHKAALVSARGYSKAAKVRALQAGIEIYRAIDTGDHDWKAEVALPALIEFTGPTKFSLSFRSVGDELFDIPEGADFRSFVLFDEQVQPLGTVRDPIGRMWNAKEIHEEPGVYGGIELAPNPLKFTVGARISRANVTASVRVEKRLHFGYWPISKPSGFFDEATGATITRHLESDSLVMAEVEKNWPRIASAEELAVAPVITLRAVDFVSADDPAERDL